MTIKMPRETVNEDTPSAVEIAKNSQEVFDPKKSRELLMQHMEESDGITMEEAIEFARIQSIWFGPEKQVVNVLSEKQDLGYVCFDEKTWTYKKASPRSLPPIVGSLPPIDYR